MLCRESSLYNIMLGCQADVLVCGPMLAHCLTADVPFEFLESYDTFMPVGAHIGALTYGHIPLYINKIKADLLNIECWDRRNNSVWRAGVIAVSWGVVTLFAQYFDIVARVYITSCVYIDEC